jgi:hypothetical protein
MNIRSVKKNLRPDLRAARERRGIRIQGGGLAYNFDPRRFASAQELAAHAASKIPITLPVRKS